MNTFFVQETHTRTLVHARTHTNSICKHTRRRAYNGTARRWTGSPYGGLLMDLLDFFVLLFLPSRSFVWPTERCILTGNVVSSHQLCDESRLSLRRHRLRLTLHPSFLSSVAAAGQRCISQGHDAGSVLLTGPASGRWRLMLLRYVVTVAAHMKMSWWQRPFFCPSFQVLDANRCFEKQCHSALSLQLAAYYYSLQIYTRLVPCFKDKNHTLYQVSVEYRQFVRVWLTTHTVLVYGGLEDTSVCRLCSTASTLLLEELEWIRGEEQTKH